MAICGVSRRQVEKPRSCSEPGSDMELSTLAEVGNTSEAKASPPSTVVTEAEYGPSTRTTRSTLGRTSTH